MRGTCCKRSSETTWHFASHELLQGLVVFSISLNLREMSVWLILTILLKYIFSWIPFPMSLICKNLKVNLNLVRELKFAKLDILLKIKPDKSNQIRFHMRIWQVEIMTLLLKYILLYMMVTMSLIFMIGFQMRKIKEKFNVSVTVPEMFRVKTL